jgi:hypothetical protein
METFNINESLKNIAKAGELLENYLIREGIENKEMLITVLSLIEKTVEILSTSK